MNHSWIIHEHLCSKKIQTAKLFVSYRASADTYIFFTRMSNGTRMLHKYFCSLSVTPASRKKNNNE